MVKLKGPIHSGDATGSLAEVLSFLRGKTVTIAKKHARPANPKSPAQKGVRAMIRFLAEQWSLLSAPERASWRAAAAGKPYAAYHAYIKVNMDRWNTMRYPSAAYPAAEVLTPTTAPLLWLTPKVASIQIETNAVGSGACWAYVHFQSLTSGFTPSPQNAVWIKTRDAWSTIFLLTPVMPGTYYHRAIPFRRDGRAGNVTPQSSVTVV